ncbi:MAG: hypothetical protein Q7S64_01785 [bacterium]|nr:hypothetical protein [bacterium]
MHKTQLTKWRAKLAQTTDALGKPIDAGIFDLVLYLNVLGFHTAQSCAGHVDWGEFAPWVEIEPVYNQSTRWFKVKANQDQVEKQNLKLHYRFINLLDRFYHTKKVPYLTTMVTDVAYYSFRLQPVGLARQKVVSTKERRAQLALYQAEIERFTRWLKRQ